MNIQIDMVQMALNQNFVRVKTDDTDKEYLEWKQEKSEEINEIEKFDINVIRGYHGDTISCKTKSIYDIYRVYEDGKLILESEDEVIELNKERKTNMDVKSYSKEGDTLILRGICGGAKRVDRNVRFNTPTLSVVVPLYNSELFMCRTIDSILCSTLYDMEIILIDDGSSDNSSEISRWYSKQYPCVRAYTQENKGVCETRNSGLELANGEFMAFCDNDDIIHPNMYQILYDACEENGTDIAIAQTLIRKNRNGDKERYLECSKHKDKDIVVYDYDELVENRNTPGNIYFVAVWNKIVRTEVARKVKFFTGYEGPGILYEDVAYTGSLYSYIDKFVYCRNAIYTWDKRKQKTVGTASTWHKAIDNDYVWKMFIYGFSYMLRNKSGKHVIAHDYTHFKRLIESYDKFKTDSELKRYWDSQLKSLIEDLKLYDNEKIMADTHLAEVVHLLHKQ